MNDREKFKFEGQVHLILNIMNLTSIDELWMILRERLAEPNYACVCPTESALEDEVWTRLVELAKQLGLDASTTCLTSHTERVGRSDIAWKCFCQEYNGPDVNVLGSNNRLDIVFRHKEYGTIGIEVKCLGDHGHALKLTQGLGQALLGLAHRDRTLLVIHCGTVDAAERKKLQKVCDEICDATNAKKKMAIIVVP